MNNYDIPKFTAEARQRLRAAREEYAPLCNYPVYISTENTKLNNRDIKIPSFSVCPVLTCRNCEECAGKCYYIRMCRRFPSTVWQHTIENTATLRDSPATIVAAVLRHLETTGARFFRWNVGGDIDSLQYLYIMCQTAKLAPRVRFLAFTKSYDIINDYRYIGGKIPRNLHIIFSAWPGLQLDNPFGYPVALFIPDGCTVPKGCRECPGNCADCATDRGGCWYLRKGGRIALN